MLSAVVSSFWVYDTFFYFVNIPGHKVVGNLEVATSAFWAFLFSHSQSSLFYCLPHSAFERACDRHHRMAALGILCHAACLDPVGLLASTLPSSRSPALGAVPYGYLRVTSHLPLDLRLTQPSRIAPPCTSRPTSVRAHTYNYYTILFLFCPTSEPTANLVEVLASSVIGFRLMSVAVAIVLPLEVIS